MPAHPATANHGLIASTGRTRTDVQKPAVKFLIGIFASLCAVLLPRLSLEVFGADGQGFKFLTWSYTGASFIFSAFIGIAVMLKEWKVPCPPWDTFMASLGIPALIAGTLNGHLDARQLNKQVETKQQLENALSDEAGVPVRSAPEVQRTGRHDSQPGGAGGAVFGLMVVAAYGVPGQAGERFGTQVVEPKYWVVLDRQIDSTRAQASAEHLRQRLTTPGVPAAKPDVVKLGQQFLVIEAGGARPRSDALLVAVRLKREHGIATELQEVPKYQP